MNLLTLRQVLFLAAVLVGSTLHAPVAHAQATVDARADLTPRVIGRAEGEKRFFPAGNFMLLKVGPENSGSSYMFMGYEDLPPGTTIPRHRHEVDEEILIVHRGRIQFQFSADTVVAGPGDAVFLPVGNWISAASVGPDTATIFFIFPRGSVEQCFQLFGYGEGEAPHPESPEELEQERRICRMSY